MIKGWPTSWPLYVQECFAQTSENACDVVEGPCSCGSWHLEGEFQYDGGILFRNGIIVNILPQVHNNHWSIRSNGARTFLSRKTYDLESTYSFVQDDGPEDKKLFVEKD